MIKINPLFPVYIEENTLRMGNLPATGKIVKNIDNNIIDMIKMTIDMPQEKKSLENFLQNRGISKRDSVDIINQLIEEDILVTCDRMNVDDRQELFFSMFNSKKSFSYSKMLSDANIMIIGLGAIGCSIANILCRVGVNSFVLIDDDVVEESNLKRQNLYFKDDIGELKTESAKACLLNIKDTVDVKEVNSDVLDVLSFEKYNPDIVICTADSPVRLVREHVNKICVRESIPLIFAGFSEYLGVVGPLMIPRKTPCWNCIQGQLGILPRDINSHRVMPSFGGLCELIGAFTATEIVKYLTGFSNVEIIGKELIIDIVSLKTSFVSWKKDETCKICSGVVK